MIFEEQLNAATCRLGEILDPSEFCHYAYAFQVAWWRGHLELFLESEKQPGFFPALKSVTELNNKARVATRRKRWGDGTSAMQDALLTLCLDTGSLPSAGVLCDAEVVSISDVAKATKLHQKKGDLLDADSEGIDQYYSVMPMAAKIRLLWMPQMLWCMRNRSRVDALCHLLPDTNACAVRASLKDVRKAGLFMSNAPMFQWNGRAPESCLLEDNLEDDM